MERLNASEREYFADFTGDTAHDSVEFDPPRRMMFDVKAAIADRFATCGGNAWHWDWLWKKTHVTSIRWWGDDWQCTAVDMDEHGVASSTILSMRFVTEIEDFDLRGYK